jgi:hypothetical protein
VSANLNPLQVSPAQGANLMGGMAAQSPNSSPISPSDNDGDEQSNPQVDFLKSFQSAWMQLQNLNSQYGGDGDTYQTMLKAAETWLSEIISKMGNSATSQAPPNAAAPPAQSPAPPTPGQMGY